MPALTAVLLVLVVTALSLWLTNYAYTRERHRRPSTTVLVIVTAWFLVSYGFMAFLVIPH
jgi:hypothetical protein